MIIKKIKTLSGVDFPDIEADYIDLEIDGLNYRIKKSVDGKLNIYGEEKLAVFPCVSNVVEVLSIES